MITIAIKMISHLPTFINKVPTKGAAIIIAIGMSAIKNPT